MVSNTSGNAQVANVFLNFNGQQHPSPAIAFNPHETKILSIADLLAKLNTSVAQAPQGSITFIQQGANPALIAQGRVMDPVTGFSSTLEFPDPARQKSSALHASGLPIGTPTTDSPFAGDGTFTPHVIASNLTSAPQTVTVTMEYPRSAGLQPGTTAILAPVGKKEFDGESGASVGQMPVASFQVPAYSTEDFSLAAVMSELPLPLPYASVRIQYSGPPGSLLAQVPSVDERQDLVIDTRTMNEGDGWAGSGANPWHLDNQTESILFLTDESDQPARIGFHVVAGGVTYYLTSLKLNPHETRAINIRKLRNVQNADFKKNKIPAGATDGSVEWNRIDNVAVTGRVVVISKQQGVASGYDCCTCPCPEGYKSLAVSPTICTLIPGSNMELTATATYRACNGPADYYDVSGNATWSSSNTSVAKMDTGLSDQVDGVGAGSCTITATYSDWNYTLSGGACIQNFVQHSGSGPMTVQVPARLVRYNTSCAPNGVGPLEIVTNGNILDCLGNVKVSGACGVYENFTFQVVDQYGNPFEAAYTLGESFSNFSSTTPNLHQPSATQATVAAGGYVADTQAAYYMSPSCLGNNDNASYKQTFTVTAGGKQYSLSTIVSISVGEFNGTKEVNDNVTTP